MGFGGFGIVGSRSSTSQLSSWAGDGCVLSEMMVGEWDGGLRNCLPESKRITNENKLTNYKDEESHRKRLTSTKQLHKRHDFKWNKNRKKLKSHIFPQHLLGIFTSHKPKQRSPLWQQHQATPFSLTDFPRQPNNFFRIQNGKIRGDRTSSKGPIKEKNPRPFISHPIENLSKNQQKTPRRPRTLFTLPPPLVRINYTPSKIES